MVSDSRLCDPFRRMTKWLVTVDCVTILLQDDKMVSDSRLCDHFVTRRQNG